MEVRVRVKIERERKSAMRRVFKFALKVVLRMDSSYQLKYRKYFYSGSGYSIRNAMPCICLDPSLEIEGILQTVFPIITP